MRRYRLILRVGWDIKTGKQSNPMSGTRVSEEWKLQIEAIAYNFPNYFALILLRYFAAF